MNRYKIHINYGDDDKTAQFYFVHRDFANMTAEQQDEEFDKAVKELNRIYKTYGRFATKVGIRRLFDSFGFEESMP